MVDKSFFLGWKPRGIPTKWLFGLKSCDIRIKLSQGEFSPMDDNYHQDQQKLIHKDVPKHLVESSLLRRIVEIILTGQME